MGEIHEIQGHIESMYLIEYPSGLLLLDGGCRCDVDVVCSYVRSLGRQPNDIRVVVVTHMHPDHAGGAEIYRQRFGAQLVTGRGVEEWYAGLEGSVQHLIDIVLAYWVASRMKKPWRWLWYPKRIRFDHTLEDGDPLPGFPDWTILCTPGHTGKDISVLHQEQGCAYLADVVLKVRGRFLAPFPIEFPELYERTLIHLQRLGLQKVLLAHGGQEPICFADFQTVLDSLPSLPKKRDVLASIFGKLIKV